MSAQNNFQNRISELIVRHLKDELTPEENGELQLWLKEDRGNQVLFEELTFEESLRTSVKEIPLLKGRIEKAIHKELPETRIVVPMFKRRLVRWVAAASIIGVLGFGAYLMFFNKAAVNSPQATVVKTNDVEAPKETKAMITLADGSTIFLDSAAGGLLAVQNNVQVVKTAEGKVIYNSEGIVVSGELVYNTLTNPRGSRVIDITLADGTRVWLNAGSSLRYPIAFEGSERSVSITGEAFFEVTHNNLAPFKVRKDAVEVTVLGTQFNVNAYDDETEIKVTLLEGAVKVSTSKQLSGSTVLTPGQQAIVTPNNLSSNINKVDIEQVMAWKNGQFYFNNSGIHSMMRQVERWYDVQVSYEDDINELFVAKISRDVPVSEFLRLLELTNLVHFRIEGKKIVVTK